MPGRWLFCIAAGTRGDRHRHAGRRLDDGDVRGEMLHEETADRMCRDSDYCLAGGGNSLLRRPEVWSPVGKINLPLHGVRVSWRAGAIALALGLDARS